MEFQAFQVKLGAILRLKKFFDYELLQFKDETISLKDVGLREHEVCIGFSDFLLNDFEVLVEIEVFQDFADGIVNLFPVDRNGLRDLELGYLGWVFR